MKPTAVVFDLDGTLIDSRRDLAAAINALRADLGLAPVPLADIGEMVGEGARVLVRRALRGERPEDDLPAAQARFLEHYDRLCLETTRPYPGMVELLAALAAERPLALLTNKPERQTKKLLAALDLAPRFRVVVGGDTLSVRKPDPATLAHIATVLAVPPSSLILVGDSRIDLDTAIAAGSACALVTWGYGTCTAADLARATAVAHDAAELARALGANQTRKSRSWSP